LASLSALLLETPGLTTSLAARLVLDSRGGRLSLVRAAVAVATLALLWSERGARRVRIGPVLTTSLGVATFPLGGHATSTRGGVIGISVAIVHVLAAGLWVGGLAMLAGSPLLNDRKYLRQALPFFGQVATASVGVLILSGTFVSVKRIGTYHDLASSDYGKTLLVKLGAVVLVMAVAAFLRFRVVPAATASEPADENPEQTWPRSAPRSLRLEAAMAGTIVVMSALLASLPPPVLR
jgi:copper transport protein